MRLLLILFFLFSSAYGFDNEGKCCKSPKGRCTGDEYCTACTNCRYCKHCSSGGSCGVCSPKKKKTTESTYNSTRTTEKSYGRESDGQCQATTKKGTRCSRSARTGGFCYQHGGK